MAHSSAPTRALALVVLLACGLTLPASPQRGRAAPVVTEIRVPGKRAVARVWSERAPGGQLVPYYSVSVDGLRFTAARATDYDLRLRHGHFDPRVREVETRPELRATPGSRIYIVQCWTQVLEDYRATMRELGVEIHRFLANHANVVEMSASTAELVRALPFVRAVVPFHPAYKLEKELLAGMADGRSGAITVNLLTMRRGGQAPVVRWIEQRGGTIEHVSEPTYLMTATLDFAELPALAALDEVQWIDRWSPPSNDMNRARLLHGSDYVESVYGITGQGVRVEVMDAGCDTTHPDMPNFLVHNGNTADAHGTCTSGIIVGNGSGMGNARGAAPDAFLVIADYNFAYAGGSRYAHTGQLVNPALPYKCVVQSNSWGGGTTTTYNSTSHNMDLILFDHDRISICQSQSNTGTTSSRPEAWAKNVIAVGGIYHHNTASKNDDEWNGGASIGPAADGRFKPDVASFYDDVLCTDMVGGAGYSGTDYTSGFGGTSAATPIVAGHLALVYQMWHEGLFGNPTPGATVFENAPYNTTAKALLIHSASQWVFSGATHDLTRTHQGWGHPDLERLALATARMLVVDESDVLGELETRDYPLEVLPGVGQLRVTLVYREPPGTTSGDPDLINDLDLTLTSPSSVVYHGNFGLDVGNYSVSGGSADSKNNVENFIFPAPEAGVWTATVSVTELNEDNHLETGALDVDYALVVSGAEPPPTAPPVTPSHLRGRAVAHQSHLSFHDGAEDELGFELERSDDGVSFTPLATLAENDTEHDDPGLTPNTDYYYRVRAYNSFGPSTWSNVVKVRTSKAIESGPP